MTNTRASQDGRGSNSGLRDLACLETGVIVCSNQAAPEDWKGCHRSLLEMSAGLQLRTGWTRRKSIAIAIAKEESQPDPGWLRIPGWWKLDPRFTKQEGSLRFLAESISITACNPVGTVLRCTNCGRPVDTECRLDRVEPENMKCRVFSVSEHLQTEQP